MKHTDLSNQDNIRKVYSYFSRGSGYPIFTPSDATISQLKNGGAFRLIKKNVSDSILAYDNFNKEIITHNDQYLKVHNEFWDETYNIIDVSIFRDTNFLPHDQYFGMSLVYYSLIWKNSRLPLISSNKKDKQRFFGLLMRLLSFNGGK